MTTAARARESLPAKSWRLLGEAEDSLFESLMPSAGVLHKLGMAAVMIGLTVGLARARFFLPENPVPITFQTFGILMMGGLLGWRWGLVSVVGYYLLGMAGVPVFQGGGNGWQYVSGGVTGGYLLGFILAVAVVGYTSQRGWNRGRGLWAMLTGSMVVYVPALIWLSVFDFSWPAEGELFSSAFYPFIPGDVVKLVLAAIVTGGLWRLVDRRNE